MTGNDPRADVANKPSKFKKLEKRVVKLEK
jgi:hypothetical protein